MADTVGMQDIRGENVDRAVKGFALQQYKMKQVCLNQSSNNWKETFYKESSAELSGMGIRQGKLKSVSRLSAFPYVEPSWTETSSRHQKHAAEGVVSWEDAKTDAIDVMARTLLRVSRAIAKSVDDAIYAVLTGDPDVNTAAAVANWDDATVANRDPILDILTGIQYMFVDNYDALSNGYLLLNPYDYTQLLNNSKVINNPSFKTADVVSNGVVGRICGLKIIVSNSVDSDEAMLIIGQLAATWKSVQSLTTKTILDPGIKYTIRAWEVGITMVTNPQAIHVITNTKA